MTALPRSAKKPKRLFEVNRKNRPQEVAKEQNM